MLFFNNYKNTLNLFNFDNKNKILKKDEKIIKKKQWKKKNNRILNNNKYKIPYNIYLIFEHMPFLIFTSLKNYNNHFNVFIPNKYYYGINALFKNEVFFNSSMLIDQSFIDCSNYKDMSLNKLDYNNINLIFKNNKLLFNIYYFFFLKIRITTYTYNFNKNYKTIEMFFKNANWLERESSEMFGINFLLKKDNRCLLLDYSKNENPLLKNFPCEGYYDIYYNYLENKLTYLNNNLIEL